MRSLELPTSGNADGLVALVARDGDETAIITTYATRSEVRDQARWYVFDDRQVYKPGETMRVKGWVRRTNSPNWSSSTWGYPMRVDWSSLPTCAPGRACPS